MPYLSVERKNAHNLRYMKGRYPALPWAVQVSGRVVARFATEEDARGFAVDWYGGDARVYMGRLRNAAGHFVVGG